MYNIKGHSSFLYITFKNKTYGGSGRSGLLVLKKKVKLFHTYPLRVMMLVTTVVVFMTSAGF